MENPRHAWAEISYDGRDITEAVTAGLLSLSYTDNIDEADEIKITVEDVDGNWAGPWYPKVASKGG